MPDTRGLLLTIGAEATEKPGRMVALAGSHATQLLAILLVSALLPLPLAMEKFTPINSSNSLDPTTFWNPNGPYVDKMVVSVIEGLNNQVEALKRGEIDQITEPLELEYYLDLKDEENVEIVKTKHLGFGFLTINCNRYPYSIPAFRRALAYAIDKEIITAFMWGELGFPVNNLFSASNGIWYNNHTTPNFLPSDINAARSELAMAGFSDFDGDGFVEAPDGSSFIFHPMYAISVPEFGFIMNHCANVWQQAGIAVEPQPFTFATIIDLVYGCPRNYDATFLQRGMNPDPLILQSYTTKELFHGYNNIPNWSNETYDALIDLMLNSSDFDEVLYASHQAQQVIVENAPLIPLYNYWDVYAYRTDAFEGWVVSSGYGLGCANYWNPRSVRLIEGHPNRNPWFGYGGVFQTMILTSMDTQNPLMSTSMYSGYIHNQIYVKLTDSHPFTHTVVRQSSNLAYDWIVTELTDGFQLDFKILTNATWHDGFPVTIDDVVFSYNYIKDYRIPTYFRRYPFLNSCKAVDNETVRIVSNGKSYWVFDNLRNWVILPKHVWEGIIVPTCFSNPQPIGCGPFKWTTRREGEYIELAYWELYHRPVFRWTSRGSPTLYIPFAGVTIIILVIIASVIYLRWDTHPPRKPDRSSLHACRKENSGVRPPRANSIALNRLV